MWQLFHCFQYASNNTTPNRTAEIEHNTKELADTVLKREGIAAKRVLEAMEEDQVCLGAWRTA